MNRDIDIFAKDIKNRLLEKEKATLSPYATLSSATKGENEFRLSFQRDRDRILHSKAFRRLKGKTQVFLAPKDDHYRTRLTHTLEVSQISRTVARALFLNEDLAEAVAFGHDLGHTPFGHFGEWSLDKIVPGGFHHAKQSERIARKMNLTPEVCDGIGKHSKGKGPILDDDLSRFARTLEGQIVRVADIVAYINHDIDDAVRAGIIKRDDIPSGITKVIGLSAKENMTIMVSDLIVSSYKQMESGFPTGVKRVYMSDEIVKILGELRTFLFSRVYEDSRVVQELNKVMDVCSSLYDHFVSEPERLKERLGLEKLYDSVEVVASDYISGMTDAYAINCYKTILGRPFV
jgi:dGTPase